MNYYVGGNTKFYGAALFRLRPEDFGELRHHGGISPAWPIRYEDLEPYYTQAEHLYLVHGRHGEDPTGGPTSAQYAYPPVEHEARIQQLSDDLGKAGLHPFHLPIGVNLTQDEHGRATHDSVCIRCDRVDGFPCLVGAKSDAQVICVDPALKYDNVTMVTNANVRRLETDPTGRTVTKVVAELKNGATEGFSADIVVVAAGAVNSAVLLLRSANDQHPGGLANSSDVVGRHYMRHNNLALMAISKEPNPTRFQKTLALNDWYLGADDWEYPLGGIQMLGKSDADQIHGEAPRWAGAVMPDMPFEVLAHHAVDFWLCGEDLPCPRAGSPSTRTTPSIWLSTRRTTSPGSSASSTSCGGCSGTWACTSTTCWITASTCTRACPSAPPRTRPALCGSATTRRVRRSTSTARPTTSTTCTSWTPASSPASAR